MKSDNIMKEFWPHAEFKKRVSSYDGGVVVELYNTSKITSVNPVLLKRIKEVDKKFSTLVDKLGKDKWDEVWKKYGDAIHGYGSSSDKDEHSKEILELIFNLLYGEMLKLEQEAFQGLDKVEKEIDAELKKLN